MTADRILKCVKCTKCIFPLKEHRLQKVTQKEKQTHVACTLYVLLLLQFSIKYFNLEKHNCKKQSSWWQTWKLQSSVISSATLTTHWYYLIWINLQVQNALIKPLCRHYHWRTGVICKWDQDKYSHKITLTKNSIVFDASSVSHFKKFYFLKMSWTPVD